ncbi:MAG: IPT/TIG domain-containing protein [Acidobacteriota bacterium]|nr:IPT/TIG domain-containing protein [Acidobacteriota bacterium]
MRRNAIGLLGIALVAFTLACSADAPAPTPPNGGGGTPRVTPGAASPLQIRLFTSNANPTAGTCSLVQAIVSLNGANVPDGTGVAFSTDFGIFQQNGEAVVSVTTQNSAAVTAICSASAGLANVRASATVAGQTGSATIAISFQPSAQAAPFFSSCSPSFASNAGGDTVTLNGGRFFGSPATTRVTFTAAGVTREALVTDLTSTSVSVRTPAFPEAISPSVPVTITLTLGTNTASPVVLTIPNCFAFGTAAGNVPTVTAILPASGTKEGGTRVTIVGSGFSSPLQVFLQSATIQVEATVISVSYNQIIILTPPASNFGLLPPINSPIDVLVREVGSGTTAMLAASFRYTQPLQITGFSPERMRGDQRTQLTIFGHGFQSPVLVTVGSVPASVISVSDSEIIVLPGAPPACSGAAGPVIVTNLGTGETASAGIFTYVVQPITITGISPPQGAAGTSVTILGTNLPTSTADADVRFNNTPATVVSVSSDGLSMVVTVPPGAITTSPVCPAGTPVGTLLPSGETVTVTVRSRSSACSATGSFSYLLPCAVADVGISKTSNPPTVSLAAGGAVTYTLSITNAGGVPATNTVASDSLPAGVNAVSCTATQGSCSVSGSVVTANLQTLAPGGSATVTINVTMVGSPRTVSNTATVSTTASEVNTFDNTSTASTVVNP